MTDNSPKPPMATEVPVVRSHEFRNHYSNHSKIGISQWDLSLVLGQLVDIGNNVSVVEEFAAIKFSPHHFKNLAAVMNESIDQWEKLFGSIVMGAGQQANLKGVEGAFDQIRGAIENAEKKPK